ncbi:MAG TPA: hypothetical protein VJ898_15305 [Natrialbaceae archaeon]|nr:hypothetical protein [Natrialbaceae archaeon]
MSQRSTRQLGGAALVAIGTLAIFGLMLVPGASMAVVGLLAIAGVIAIAAGTLILGVGGSDGERVA